MRVRASVLIPVGLVLAVGVWSQRTSSSLVFARQPDAKLFMPAVPAQAGHADHKERVELSVAVDGAKTPELVPDKIAYKHFVLALAIPSRSQPLVKRESLLDVSGLVAVAALKAREDAVLDVAKQRMDVELSFDGFNRVQSYVHQTSSARS